MIKISLCKSTATMLFVILFCPIFIKAQVKVMDKEGIIAEGARVVMLADGFEFTEGPAADKEGNVYFTDQPNNKIFRWSADTQTVSIFSVNAGRSNGLFFDQNGHLIACADGDNQLWAFDSAGNHTVLIEDFNGNRLNGPNDLWIAPKGGMYVTDPLYKRSYWDRDPSMQQNGEHVYYFSPDRKHFTAVEEALEKPNGIIGTPDGKKLYIADIGADKTFVYDILEDGSLAEKRLFVSMGSDGMTIDDQGNIYLTGKGVTVFNPAGEKIAHIPIEENWTANVTFGGKKGDILFITAMDSIYGLKMKVKAGK